MTDFEKLGVFYLGRECDPQGRQEQPEPLLYDSRNLTTHAVCVGMTGSGKTGLGVALLEEAAIDGIPSLVIDPKGDLGNLLLTFPDLQPGDFLPWVEEEEAVRQGIPVEELAARTAERWRQGLAGWGEDGARIARFARSVERVVYTPGSSAGRPLSILRSLHAPAASLREDPDLLREQVQNAVSGLLALLGLDADPLQSREHILLATLVERSWRAGEDLDLPALIRGVQSPPFDQVGVFDLQSFYPAKERFGLAMTLNNLLASPSFASWTEGEPLDIRSLLYTPDGRPRLSVLSIAHLGDAERMFFVTTLLNELVGWMRAQPGTSSLRALLYMDELFGYLPPTANPPSKRPLLTLLKQARAFGLGVVLATQNPVDLDYKALSNAGTWFIGKLQTERDRLRMLDGLTGAGGGEVLDRAALDQTLGALAGRVFLLHDVRARGPVVFKTRWALSFLRGPLTRAQLRALAGERPGPAPQPADLLQEFADEPASRAVAGARPGPATAGGPPLLPPEVPVRWAMPRRPLPPGSRLLYRPRILATARLHYVSAPAQLDLWRPLTLFVTPEGASAVLSWEGARPLAGDPPPLATTPPAPGEYEPLPAAAAPPKSYPSWAKTLRSHLYQSQALTLWKSPTLRLISRPGESEGDYRIRVRLATHELRDQGLDKLRRRYEPKVQRLQDQIARAEDRLQKEREQLTQRGAETALDLGSTVLGALFGRRVLSAGNARRAAGTLKSAGRAAREGGDLKRAQEQLHELRARLQGLDEEVAAEVERTRAQLEEQAGTLEPLTVAPRKGDITVSLLTLVWSPWAVAGDEPPVPLI